MKLNYSAWGVWWRSKEVEHFLRENRIPVLFKTRQEARMWATKKYGYIKNRKDLRDEPHRWRLPRPVRVNVLLRGGGE